MAKRVRSRKEENRDDGKDATEREQKREKGGTAAETKAAPKTKTAPAGVKKKRVNEIDDLFSSLGATKNTPKNTPKKTPSSASAGGTTHSKGGREDSKEAAAGSKKSSSKGRLVGSKDDIFGTGDVGGRKTTEEGYKIYSEEELGLGVSTKNAGYTKDWWVPTSTAVRPPRLSHARAHAHARAHSRSAFVRQSVRLSVLLLTTTGHWPSFCCFYYHYDYSFGVLSSSSSSSSSSRSHGWFRQSLAAARCAGSKSSMGSRKLSRSSACGVGRGSWVVDRQ